MAAVATLRAPLPAGDGDSPWTQCALGPNGRVYCALHRQIICFACRCDYSYVGSYIGELEAWELEAEAEGVPNHFPDSNVDVAMEQMDSPMGEISVDLSLPEVRTGNWHVFPEVFGQSHQEAQDIIQERWMPEHGEALYVARYISFSSSVPYSFSRREDG
jgi:hypothetical protein